MKKSLVSVLFAATMLASGAAMAASSDTPVAPAVKPVAKITPNKAPDAKVPDAPKSTSNEIQEYTGKHRKHANKDHHGKQHKHMASGGHSKKHGGLFAAVRSEKSLKCSADADAKALHGKARKEFRKTCLKAA